MNTLKEIYDCFGKEKMFEEAQKRLTSKDNVIKVFEEIYQCGMSDLYALVQWPESQDIMDRDWFEEEAILALGAEDSLGSSAYFVPANKLHINNSDDFKGFM